MRYCWFAHQATSCFTTVFNCKTDSAINIGIPIERWSQSAALVRINYRRLENNLACYTGSMQKLPLQLQRLSVSFERWFIIDIIVDIISIFFSINWFSMLLFWISSLQDLTNHLKLSLFSSVNFVEHIFRTFLYNDLYYTAIYIDFWSRDRKFLHSIIMQLTSLFRECLLVKTISSSSSNGTLVSEHVMTIRNVNNGNSKVNARANCELRYGTGRTRMCVRYTYVYKYTRTHGTHTGR